MYEEINKSFSNTVNDLLNNGYRFHVATMCGHQGELSKVDLYKGTTMIRVALHKKWDSDNTMCHTVVLSVGKWNKPAFSSDTAWESDIEVYATKTWYSVSQNEKWYTNNPAIAKACREKHFKRYACRHIKDATELSGDKYLNIAKTLLKRKGIAKRFSDAIKIIKHFGSEKNKYCVLYKNHSYWFRLAA